LVYHHINKFLSIIHEVKTKVMLTCICIIYHRVILVIIINNYFL